MITPRPYTTLMLRSHLLGIVFFSTLENHTQYSLEIPSKRSQLPPNATKVSQDAFQSQVPPNDFQIIKLLSLMQKDNKIIIQQDNK